MLQAALPSTLNDFGTCVSDDGAAQEGNATLQGEDLLVKLRNSDTFNRKNMCKFLESHLTDDSSIFTPNSTAKNETPSNNSSAAEKFQNRTNIEILGDSADAMYKMVTVVESSTSNLCDVVKAQNNHL